MKQQQLCNKMINLKQTTYLNNQLGPVQTTHKLGGSASNTLCTGD